MNTRLHCFLGLLFAMTLTGAAAMAETYTIQASITGNNEEFENVANQLQPGDELVLEGGTYSQTGRRAITCVGTPENPILIRAAEGQNPVLTRPVPPNFNYPQNGIEVIDSAYLIIRGIHFRGGNTGVRFIRGHHITFEDCEVSETSNNAVTLNSGDTNAFIIRRNHLHHTGLLDESIGETEGEGMYVGCNNAGCIASNHIIEGNYIHDLRATSWGGNDGIEIKYGSYGNTIRDNVIHDTVDGKQYPGVFVYGVIDPSKHARNVVEGNIIWNSGEGIYAVSDAIIRNNIVLKSLAGITTYRHGQVPQVRNLTIVNNTVLSITGEALYVRWNEASNMILANNAIYNKGVAVNAQGLSGAEITVLSNYVEGTLNGVSLSHAGLEDGGSAIDAFVAIPGYSINNLDIENVDLWPAAGSPLIGTGNAQFAPGTDFNGTERQAPIDVGAYQTAGLEENPGWKITSGLKGGDSPAPVDTVAPGPPTDLKVW